MCTTFGLKEREDSCTYCLQIEKLLSTTGSFGHKHGVRIQKQWDLTYKPPL